MRFRHPRLWSSFSWIFWITLVLAAIIVSTAYLTAKKDGPVWPAVAAAVALTGVIATAIGVLANYRRQKRQETIDAWLAWKEDSATSRSENFKTFGKTDLTEVQARALALAEGTLRDGSGKDLTDLDRRKAARHISLVLNGLESLAVGVYHGVYDIKVLNALGHSIIVDTTRRFHTYVRVRQATTEKAKRQETAFEALCVLADQLEALEERRKKKNSDRGIVSYLRGS